AFCDARFSRDYMAEPGKVVRFLNETVFTRNKIIVNNRELGYTDPIGLRHHDPKEFPEEGMEEEKVILANFSVGTGEQLKENVVTLHFEHDYGPGLEVDPNNESTSDDREAELDTSEEEPDDVPHSNPSISSRCVKAPRKKTKASKAIRAEYKRTKVYRITAPLGKESVEAVLKALNYLWEV
ncbi:hypothetical protein BG004_001161, partial [Podila humilis]